MHARPLRLARRRLRHLIDPRFKRPDRRSLDARRRRLLPDRQSPDVPIEQDLDVRDEAGSGD